MLFLRRFCGEALLVVPNRTHTADEITKITVRDIGPRKDVGFGFDIAPGFSICLDERYQDRHGHDLADINEERCSRCGVPIGLFAEDGKELHVAKNLCASCHLHLTARDDSRRGENWKDVKTTKIG